MLAPAALAAVRKWKYRPFEVDGRPARVQTEVEVNIPEHVDEDDLARERKF
jgi:outer membrane biosynthesis protein TonB